MEELIGVCNLYKNQTILLSQYVGTLKIVPPKKRVYGVDVVYSVRKKRLNYSIYFRPKKVPGGDQFQIVPDSKIFCKEQFGWVKCYNESIGGFSS